MTDRTDILIAIVMGGTMFVLFLCSWILVCGGFGAYERDERPNTIQRLFAGCVFVEALTFVPFLANNYLTAEPSRWLNAVIDALCVATCGFVPLEARALKQLPLRWCHWCLAFLPGVLLVAIVSVVSVDYPQVYVQLNALVYLVYLVWMVVSVYRLKRWDRQMLELYSDVSRKQTAWFRRVMAPFIVFTLLWLPLGAFPDARWIQLVYYVATSVIFLSLTNYAVRQETFPVEHDEAEEEKQTIDTTDVEDPAWVQCLQQLMTEQHIYRKPGLTGQQLAALAGVNRTYLSRYLNNTLKTTFYDYVNGYRLDESETLLKKGKMTISEIAEQCGFCDRSAFCRIFRKRHNMTPSKWLEAKRQN